MDREPQTHRCLLGLGRATAVRKHRCPMGKSDVFLPSLLEKLILSYLFCYNACLHSPIFFFSLAHILWCSGR